MAKRFHDTDIWSEDWFISIPKDYRTFWLYLKDDCDYSGVWRPKISAFNKLNECTINLDDAFVVLNTGCNGDGPRIIKLDNGHWFLTRYIPFQYGHKLNIANRVHKAVLSVLEKEGVNLTSIRPQVEVTQGLKEKEKEKEKDNKGVIGGDFKKELAKVEKDYRDGTISLSQKEAEIDRMRKPIKSINTK